MRLFVPFGHVVSIALLILPVRAGSDHLQPDHVNILRRQQAGTPLPAAASSTGRHSPQEPTSSLPAAAAATASSSGNIPAQASYGPGSINPFVAGAPPLPDVSNFDFSDFPPLDQPPPLNTPQMRAWIASVDLTKAPTWSPTGLNGCSNSTVNAQAMQEAGPDGRCWWTCQKVQGQKCTRKTDITYCPTKNTWGASFDDGPSDNTPRLLSYLSSKDIKATFFVVGSRVISRPATLQAEYMAGHQISVHTWSHRSLGHSTSDGVTPNTMRPPYGDIDDRVRYISLALGLTPIIWTQAGFNTFDTQDWRLEDPNQHVTQTDVLGTLNSFLDASRALSTGFIVLAHDLYASSVDLAINHILPSAVAFRPQLSLQLIVTCLGEPNSGAYIETRVNGTDLVAVNSTARSSAASTVEPNSTVSAMVTAMVTATLSRLSSPSSLAAAAATSSRTSGVALSKEASVLTMLAAIISCVAVCTSM
ncbi:BQ2448_1902 [Microbotryum intermedium]|uniref:chitin deacetylase n=1 Tax=Microbotryum intermedium TaxID=269621 RepID=A0A238FH87_9BASI|nr:BQ2448_1902 [Microbotryum intermedium]